jgi:hypothetical protein
MRKIVNRRVRRQGKAGTLAADITAVVAGNVGEPGRTTAGSKRQTLRIVQRRGRTQVSGADPERD